MLEWLWQNADKIAALCTAVGLLAVAYTLFVEARRFRRTLALSVHGQLLTSSFNALIMLLERPELRPFLYEGRELSKEVDLRLQQQVKIACEMYSDHFELVCLQMERLKSEGSWPGWVTHMTDVISRSPSLRQHFRETAAWITAPAFQEVVAHGFRRAHESVPAFGSAAFEDERAAPPRSE
jgi:hypothetical protein